MHFGAGERDLSRWMDQNAYVSWVEIPEPWLLEDHLIETLDLPLNLDKNNTNSFHSRLNEIRSNARLRARSLPILPNPGVGGSVID